MPSGAGTLTGSWLVLCLCAMLPWEGALPALAAAPASIAPNPLAIEALRQGRRAVAHAVWWGFDPADATAALQSAIRSGARKVVVSNVGSPWIVTPIQLAGHQEIVFEPGVVVQAKRGGFRGRGDSLFTARLQTNVTLTGYGATFKMWKQDYDQPPYEKAEWRHALSLRSCSQVTVAGLTLADSGGDGIYLGVAQRGVPNRDVRIKDVICDNNYRQGISVICAENLLIEHCVLKHTGGTAPQAGIDFEPNHASERLMNCVLRDCLSQNNRGDAFEFYLKQLQRASAPVSIRLENCRSTGCRRSVSLGTGNELAEAAVRGRIEFVNCQFDQPAEAAVSIREKPAAGLQVRFAHCAFNRPAAEKPDMAPIVLISRPGNRDQIGGIEFADCVLRDPIHRRPMAYEDGAGLRIAGISGTLTVEGNGRRQTHHLDKNRIDTWMPHQAFKDIPALALAGWQFEPVTTGKAFAGKNNCLFRQRGPAEWLLWAPAGQQLAFTVRIQRVGRTPARPAAVALVSPSGKHTRLKKATGDASTAYAIPARETGAYRIVCDPGTSTAQVDSRAHRLCLYAKRDTFHLLGPRGELFFWVPKGTREFGIKVIGGGGIERVHAALIDPAGRTQQARDNIDRAVQFVGTLPVPSPGEIWRLRLDQPTAGVLEDCFVQLEGLPPVLAGAKAALLKPATAK